MKTYQENYASGRPQMYDAKSRIDKAKRIVKTLAFYYGKEEKLKSLNILDIGSSTGIIDNHLSRYFKFVTGIDIDEKAIRFAKKNFKRKNLKFKKDDAMNLGFKDNSFDVVICAQIYEHVPNASKLFKEIYRVLKKDGICYLAALNKLWPLEPHYNLLFLSYLPKDAADFYVKAFRRTRKYYETLVTYWSMKRLTKAFNQIDYTPKILSNPKKFGYSNPAIPFPIAKILTYFCPTNFWVLRKI